MTIHKPTVMIILGITVSGLCPSSGILKTREHNVLETGSVLETLCSLVFRVLDDGQSPKT
jgi:hypothetical protein